jgi:hypothetical protein
MKKVKVPISKFNITVMAMLEKLLLLFFGEILGAT